MRLILDLTKRCNMRCPGCIYLLYDKHYFQNKTMTLEYAIDLLVHAKSIGITNLYITAEGEVSLVSYLPTLINYAIDAGFNIILNTNGMILSDQLKTILLHISNVYISLDGFDKDTYQAHRGIDAFDRVTDNIRALISERQSIDQPHISIAHVIYEERLDQVIPMIELAEQLGVNRLEFFNFHQPGDPIPGFTGLSANSDISTFFYKILLATNNHKVEIAFPGPIDISQSPFYCENLSQTYTVGTEGYLAPCCRIPPDPKYGTLTLPSEELSLFQKSFSDAVTIDELPQPCKKCQGLNPKTFIFDPDSNTWKTRTIQDTFEMIQ